jgi:hypothetical protein
MAPRFILSAPPANPLMQILYLIVGAILVIASIVMGAVILAFVFGFALVFGIIVWIRIWWLQRKFRRAAGSGQKGPKAGQRPGAGDGVEITQVEYHVVREQPRDED